MNSLLEKNEKIFVSLFNDDLKLLFCGGKGGVGKTTIAGTVALDLARQYHNKQFMVLSIDPAQCECIPVTIPTEMALRETQCLVESVKRANIPLRRLIVNRIISDSSHCRFCQVANREQQQILYRFEKAFPDLKMIRIPFIAEGIKDVDALARVFRFV